MGCPMLCLFGFPNSILVMNIAITALPPSGSMAQAEKLQTSSVLLAEREISSSLFSQQGTETLQVGWPPCGIGLGSARCLRYISSLRRRATAGTSKPCFPPGSQSWRFQPYTREKGQPLEAAGFLPSLHSCSDWRKSPALPLEPHVAFSLCNRCILIETSF